MSGRHIAINTWLEALGLQAYLPVFSNYAGVEDLLYASESEIRDLGLKNAAHRAKIVSSLRILREKYEKGKTTGSGVFTLQQPKSPTSPTGKPIFAEFPPVIVSPEKLQQDLQRELNADPSELKSRPWYHGSISRQHAESLVTAPGDFLVRDSNSKPGDFVLTCSWRGVPLHFMVNALVGDCAPGSLPSISYQFEEERFGSIQELIQSYMTRQKPVTLASGAVLRNPVARSMPLSYYDSKYGFLRQSGNLDTSGGYYTPSQSPTHSPFVTPNHSPKTSPSMSRRRPQRTGSQPRLSVDDSEMVDRSRSPSLERFGSLPVINVIPPGGPGYEERTSRPKAETSPGSAGYHQRSGSAPVLMDEAEGNGRASPAPSTARIALAGSESNLTRAPPPKPSRIPSIKYKQRPTVAIRNQELYEDDGRDYTDPDQLAGPPSWTEGFRTGMELRPAPSSPTSVTKSHSFQLGNNSSSSSESGGVYDNNFNDVSKGYHTLPTKSRTTARKQQQHKQRLVSGTMYPINGQRIGEEILGDGGCGRFPVDNEHDAARLKERQMTMPGFNLGSRLFLDSFASSVFGSADNRLLEPSALHKTNSVLLNSNARALAGYLTKVDLEVLRVAKEDDLGLGVTSGVELCTLPQGERLREDIIERCECQRLFVMTSLMTCNAVTERAKMLSQWIQTAAELRVSMGNLFAFASIMEALISAQVQRLKTTWLILRQNHTSSAFTFDTKLRPLLKSLNEGNGVLLQLQDVTVPNLSPAVQLLQRELDDEFDGRARGGPNLDGKPPRSMELLMSWEASDPIFGLDLLLAHLDIARLLAAQADVYRSTAARVLREFGGDGGGGGGGSGSVGGGTLEDVCRTEFHMRLMWGSKGARAPRRDRLNKFQQLLGVLSERLEPPGDDGTEV